MYKITIRGADPVFVDDVKGQKIWSAWKDENKVLPAKLVIGNTAFYSSDIRNVVRVEKTEAEKARNTAKEEAEYQAYRRSILALSLDDRAKRMVIPNMLWRSVTKEPMPEELKTKIIERQKQYFEKNPKCIHANPKVYRELLPKFVTEPITENMSIAKNVIPTSVMGFIEEILRTDLQYSVKI